MSFVSSVLNPVVPVTLNPIQAAFLACTACTERFSFYVGGIGAGKTTAGALRAIARAIEQPGSLGLIGAPTYPMLRDATQRTFFELLPEETLPVITRGRKRPAHTTDGLKPG